ncbi:MAG: hypothetical protein IKQ07_05215 [Bacteroidaceae bacterium]|nr:hypothetical protein [Bacteroidaceae bacterium]
MKKTFLLAFLCTMATAMNAENTDISGMDNVVYIEPCSAETGSQYVLSVKMKNSVEAEGFGFDLLLPEGITVALDEYNLPIAELSTLRTDATRTNHFDADFKLDGTLNIQAYSTRGLSINGNDGEVALITVNIAADMEPGTYPIQLKNIAISDVNSVTYTVDMVETSIEIVKGDGRIVLDETATTVPATATNVNVRVKRTINAGEWSTICLPFAMTEAQVKEAFGDDVQLADFKGTEPEYDDDDNCVAVTVNFDAASAIESNHPYIIKVTQPVEVFTVDGVDIVADEDEAYIEFDNGKTGSRKVVYSGFYGTYHAGTVLDEFTLFLNGNKFWYSTGQTKMKAFRAYFDFYDDVLTEVENAAGVIEFKFGFDDATGIDNVNLNLNHSEATFNLAGQRVGKNYKGIVVTKGKKALR